MINQLKNQRLTQGKSDLFKLLKYTPLPAQLKFHASQKKFKGYIGGLGSGKSHAGVMESIYLSIKYPKITGVILAPTVRVLKDSTMKTFFNFCPERLVKDHNRTNNNLQIVNGTEILFRNCEDERSIDRLRNIEIGWFWIDEARGVPEYAWRVLVGRLRQKKSPLVGSITTTPKGFNWIHRKFVRDVTENYEVVFSSSRKNIHLPKEYIKTLNIEYSGVFAQQEIEGMFVKFEGLVYKEFSREVHVIDSVKGIEFRDIVLGIDWGFVNPTAIVVVGIDHDKRMYVLDEFYETQVKRDRLEEVLREFKDKYNYKTAYADPSEAFLIDDLNDKQFRIEKAVNDVVPGISEISSRLKIQEDGKTRFYILKRCKKTLAEFETYRYPDKKEDKPEQEKPIKVMDHSMDAIRYVSMGIKREVTGFMDYV